MLTDESVQLFKQSVDQAQSIFIFVSAQVKFDQAASALALYDGLHQLGKEVYLLSPVPLAPANFDGLTGIEHFSQQIGNKNLQVSFDYQPDMVDKVSYNIDEETQKFYLIIQPKKGTSPLDSQTVQFSYTGANVDLIITIGVTNLESLDGLYYGFEQLFNDSTVMSIHGFETEYGTVKLNTSGAAAFSESTARLLQGIGATFTPESASNLLAGLEVVTDDFRSAAMTADTFEVVSQLIRAGGHRLPLNKVAKQGREAVSVNLPKGVGAQSSAEPNQNQNKSASTNGFAQAIHQNNTGRTPKTKNNQSSVSLSETPRAEGGSRL